MSFDLILKPSCSGCGSTTDLYGSNCKHMTLCLSCGKAMAQNHGKCYECGTTLTRLIREYNVRASSSNDKNYFIGRFVTGLPNFSKKKSAENKWSLNKEALQGRQITDALREKYKNKPWLLEDGTGQFQYHGQLEGAPSATYYLLMMQGKEFVAIPAGSWYNFNKVAKYKQLTLEEAEEKIAKRKKNADGYERWMMKAANNGAAAFGEVKFEDKESGGGGGGGKGRKKGVDDEDGGNVSDNDDDDEEGGSKKKILSRNKGGDDDEEGPRGGDFDDEDDDVDKGDDWEHEEIFTDDDEAIGHDAEDREDLAPEIPPPPEIKQDEEDEDEMNEEEGGLSKSGKELKKLLGRTNGLNESDADDDDDEDDVEDDTSPVLAPKQKDAVKEEPADNSPVKPATTGSSKGTPTTSKSSKGKRKASGDDAKGSGSVPTKKVKTENDTKTSVKEEGASASKGNVAPKGIQTPPSKTGPVSEEEIKAVLMKRAPVTTGELVGEFKARLKTPEDKKAFADILKRISKIQKAKEGSYVILRNK